jgi:endonuclease YncB( thermonuclease family)
MVRLAIIFVASLWAWPAAAQAVVDGDTIKLKGVTWHLWGIDAPENKQSCGTYPAGTEATGTLAKLMRDKTITCEHRGTDRDGHMSGLCRADGDDLSAAMVRLGMAWADVQYSRDYVQLEDQAKAAGLGVHTHACQPAWEWRAEHAPARQPSTPPARPQ